MKVKNQIIELRARGKSYKQIQKEIGCSLSTISYHLGKGQKEKTKLRLNKYREKNPLLQKIDNFKKSEKAQMKNKIASFHRLGKNKTYSKRNFYYKDIIEKYGNGTKCYLTGRKVDLFDSNTYELDHIIPKAKGGSNTLMNLGIACKDANQAKGALLIPDFLQLCHDILVNFGYKVEIPEEN